MIPSFKLSGRHKRDWPFQPLVLFALFCVCFCSSLRQSNPTVAVDDVFVDCEPCSCGDLTVLRLRSYLLNQSHAALPSSSFHDSTRKSICHWIQTGGCAITSSKLPSGGDSTMSYFTSATAQDMSTHSCFHI